MDAQPKDRAEVINYAASLGISGTVAAIFWEYGVSTSWTMKDGQSVKNWRLCFSLWVQKMQGRPGFEIAIHDKDKPYRQKLSEQERKERQRTAIIVAGRRRGASYEEIGLVLKKYGLTW